MDHRETNMQDNGLQKRKWNITTESNDLKIMTMLYHTFSPGPLSTDQRQSDRMQLGKHFCRAIPGVIHLHPCLAPQINLIQFQVFIFREYVNSGVGR